MRRARTTTTIAGVLATALATSLAVSTPATADSTDSGTPTGNAAPTDSGTLTAFHDQEVEWAPCAEDQLHGLECADVEVPLDYSEPDGERITVAISRNAIDDPELRRGILLTNPGGPGGTGRSMPLVSDLEEGVWGLGGQRIAQVYDIIGMDPRGSGGSSPRLDCGADAPYTPPGPSDEEINQITGETIRYSRACDQADGDLRPHMTTANTARDMDVIRAALDEETLNYLGYSYGTYLGAVYGSLFPERLDRSVLDSPVHPDRIWRDVFMGMAPAYSANMERYTEWVAEQDDLYGFGTTPEEVVAAFEETSERLEENPRDDVPGIPEGVVYTHHDFDFAVGYIARFQGAWDVNSADLRYFVHDEPFPEVGGTEPVEPAPEPENDYQAANADLLSAVLCEADWPDRLSRYHADMRQVAEDHPFGLGAYWAAPQACTFGAESSQPTEPLVELERDGYSEALLIAGEYDANTAYEGGPAMAARLDSPLVTVLDEGGHGFYGMPGMNCVTAAVDAYLVDGAAPEEADCPGLPRPTMPANAPLSSDGTGDVLARAYEEMREDLPLGVGPL